MVRTCVLGLVALLGIAGAAPGEPPETAEDTRVPLRAVVSVVAAWVADELGVPVPELLPNVRLASRQALVEMTLADSGEASLGGAGVAALYDPEDERIYLPTGWTGRTPEEVSLLVHEMVHHFQSLGDTHFACQAEREREAYAVQDRWLGLFGGSLATSFGLEPLFLLVATTCTLP
jgi:hypothetical protein